MGEMVGFIIARRYEKLKEIYVERRRDKWQLFIYTYLLRTVITKNANIFELLLPLLPH